MLSLVDLRRRIEAGTLTPEGAIRLSQEAILARDPVVRATVVTDPAPAVTEDGPLAGIAVGVKDIIDTAAMPTQMGSPIYAGWQPKADAAIVMRLKASAAVALAKTTTSPFASIDPRRRPTRTIPTTRPGARRRARPPRSARGCCRWRSARRPAAR